MKINRSIALAAVIALGAAGWIISGQFANGARTDGSEIESSQMDAAKDAPKLMSVRVRESMASPYQSAVTVAGRTEASRQIELKSQILGRVVAVEVTEGRPVKAGEVIIRFDPEDREAKRQMAKARIAQREVEFNAADRLADKGFQAKTRRAEAFANLQEAKAELARIEEEIRRLTVKAPFDAVLNETHVELGDVVQSGDPVAALIDLDPILIVAQVSEQERIKLKVGQPGQARLLDGTVLTGTVRYIASAADPQTRTFKVEVEVPNPDSAIDQGITAGVVLPLREVSAHRLSAGIFTLNDDGLLGVMIVGPDDTVQFRRVTVIDSDANHAYVTGLPERIRLISVGQEFVKQGDKVRPVPEAASGTAAALTN